jgi:hypothetical protein
MKIKSPEKLGVEDPEYRKKASEILREGTGRG